MQLPVRVITDSASDLPSDLAGDADIRVVPLDVRFGDELFVVGQTIDGPSFWRRLATAADLPETAPPPPHRFSLEIKEAANDGARGVVILTMSAEVSATYQAAVMAAEEQASTIPIRVVDSGTLSMAQGFAALAAARRAQSGADVAEVAAVARQTAVNSGILATLDTLDFLQRGGRLGAAGAFFGNLLNVKPLLTIVDGVVAPAGRTRSRAAAIQAVADGVLGVPGIEDIAVLHGQARDVEALIEALSPRFQPDRLVRAELGPVIGTHTGPGALGVAYTFASLPGASLPGTSLPGTSHRG